MRLLTVAGAEHVDEAIRLFKASTMNAVQSGHGMTFCVGLGRKGNMDHLYAWGVFIKKKNNTYLLPPPFPLLLPFLLAGPGGRAVMEEVKDIEKEIRRRLPIGSQCSVRALRDEFSRQVRRLEGPACYGVVWSLRE